MKGIFAWLSISSIISLKSSNSALDITSTLARNLHLKSLGL